MDASPRRVAPDIVPLAPAHAAAAARLHIAGQPGTFLTGLGPEVLTVLYELLPQSQTGFGFAALDKDPADSDTIDDGTDGRLLGFISATTGIGALFIELGARRMHRFLPPLLRRYVRCPRLALQTLQTAAYPLLVGAGDSSDDSTAADTGTAELLSIMVDPAYRGRSVGAALLERLVGACNKQAIPRLDVTVDAANTGARRFYARHGFVLHKEFSFYGRPMCLYQRSLAAAGQPSNYE